MATGCHRAMHRVLLNTRPAWPCITPWGWSCPGVSWSWDLFGAASCGHQAGHKGCSQGSCKVKLIQELSHALQDQAGDCKTLLWGCTWDSCGTAVKPRSMELLLPFPAALGLLAHPTSGPEGLSRGLWGMRQPCRSKVKGGRKIPLSRKERNGL